MREKLHSKVYENFRPKVTGIFTAIYAELKKPINQSTRQTCVKQALPVDIFNGFLNIGFWVIFRYIQLAQAA